jgi:hypothetical protein
MYLCPGPEAFKSQRYIELEATSGFKNYISTCTHEEEVSNPNLHHRGIWDCDRCGNTGKVQWGGKSMPTHWNGTPLFIDLTTGRIMNTYKDPSLSDITGGINDARLNKYRVQR